MSLSRVGSLALVFVALACGGKEFTGLQPKLEVKSPAINAETKHYVVDFGRVSLGATGYKSVIISNIGRATMSVPPIAGLAPPFAQALKTTANVAVQAALPLSFSFAPTAAGVSTQSTVLASSGGSVTVDFLGTGVDGPAPVCEYTIEPMPVDFGNVLPGASVTSGIRFTNTGSVDCDLTNIQLDPSTNAAFTLAAGQPAFATVAPGDGAYRVGVTFAPTVAGDSLTGKLTFTVGPQGAAVEVPLVATSVLGDCAFTVAPTSLAFGNVAIGQTKSLSATITQTGSTACSISSLQVDPSSNAAFSLASGQATSGTLTGSGSTFDIQAKFSPTTGGTAFNGKITFVVGPQNTTFELPLSGASTTSTCTFRVTPSALAFGALVA